MGRTSVHQGRHGAACPLAQQMWGLKLMGVVGTPRRDVVIAAPMEASTPPPRRGRCGGRYTVMSAWQLTAGLVWGRSNAGVLLSPLQCGQPPHATPSPLSAGSQSDAFRKASAAGCSPCESSPAATPLGEPGTRAPADQTPATPKGGRRAGAASPCPGLPGASPVQPSQLCCSPADHACMAQCIHAVCIPRYILPGSAESHSTSPCSPLAALAWLSASMLSHVHPSAYSHISAASPSTSPPYLLLRAAASPPSLLHPPVQPHRHCYIPAASSAFSNASASLPSLLHPTPCIPPSPVHPPCSVHAGPPCCIPRCSPAVSAGSPSAMLPNLRRPAVGPFQGCCTSFSGLLYPSLFPLCPTVSPGHPSQLCCCHQVSLLCPHWPLVHPRFPFCIFSGHLSRCLHSPFCLPSSPRDHLAPPHVPSLPDACHNPLPAQSPPPILAAFPTLCPVQRAPNSPELHPCPRVTPSPG